MAVSDDGRQWRRVDDVRRLPDWGWAGRTLFLLTGESEELLLPGVPARHLRVELVLPAQRDRLVTGVCARGEPLRS